MLLWVIVACAYCSEMKVCQMVVRLWVDLREEVPLTARHDGTMNRGLTMGESVAK